MSESTNAHERRANVRRQLLTSVSAAALLVTISMGSANAASTYLADSDRPPLWIELGGNLEHVDGGLSPLINPFETAAGSITDGTEQSNLQNPPSLDFGLEGKISFQPTGSDWILSASVRYGRSQHTKNFHKTTVFQTLRSGHNTYPFLDTQSRNAEDHTIVDFQVGKDVGLGMFAERGSSIINAGVRIAQFNSQIHAFATSSPRPTFFTHYVNRGKSQIERSTWAFGPSIAWNGSASMAGSSNTGLFLDWGANAALLFGRQKVSGHFSTRTEYVIISHSGFSTHTGKISRHSNKIVPNVGGSLGLSYRLPAAKLSIGYRADMFFSAVDGGAQTAKTYNRGFYGPFATISIGIGG